VQRCREGHWGGQAEERVQGGCHKAAQHQQGRAEGLLGLQAGRWGAARLLALSLTLPEVPCPASPAGASSHPAQPAEALLTLLRHSLSEIWLLRAISVIWFLWEGCTVLRHT